MIPVKVCGLSTPEAVATAAEGGAAFIGFVFYPPSPRAVDPALAARLAADLLPRVRTVALFVDPSDEELHEVLKAFSPDMIQLHGGESPERVRAIRALTGLPIVKAVRVAEAADVEVARDFEGVADWILFDAKPPGAALPGGTGRRFDWNLLKDWRGGRPWMLSGGIDSGNVTEALATLRPDALDLSSGVEDSPGRKSPALIRDFLDKVRGL